MGMARKFKTVEYEKALDMQLSMREVLSADHMARFVVEVLAELDMSGFYKQYSDVGAPPYAPEVMLGLLMYGYATGIFSSRKIEKATYEIVPFRFIAGGMHPDHATLADFRKRFLKEIEEIFVQILLVAQAMGHLKLGNVSLDGSKIHADASKSKAVSYKRLLEIDAHLQKEVAELLALADKADGGQLPEGMVIEDEVARRQQRREQLQQAKQVLDERAKARYAAEKAEYDAKMAQREAKAAAKGQKPSGRTPTPPTPGARDKDQYNFTDPDSRIMKNPTNKGFDQHYNAQVVADHDSRLLVGTWVCNHPNDKQAALPTIDTISPQVGVPTSASLDNGYFSQDNIDGLHARLIDPLIATGRTSHQWSWQAYFFDHPLPPDQGASAKEKMAYKLRTLSGKAVYRLRKSTIEPIIGIIKEVLGFRQFSLRGLRSVRGEWSLVCSAYNLKRLHTLSLG